MTNDFAPNVVKAIRALYKQDTSAQALFDWAAQRERDAASTSLDRICRLLEISRGEAVALARRLEETKCGEFVVGRRGQKSRFRWDYSCISLGQAAAGESMEIEEADNPIPENEEDMDGGSADIAPIQSALRLTIAEAKAVLANSLGVPLANIEITIKG